MRLDGMAELRDAPVNDPTNSEHVILGLLHLKSYKQLSAYISRRPITTGEETACRHGKTKSPIIAGFCPVKLLAPSDFRHSPVISSDSQLPDNNNEDCVTVLITALGDLSRRCRCRIRRRKISVSLHYATVSGWLHCEVSDDGPGIEPERIEAIF
ncbi:hypothetical protein KCP71_03910 [Salmonella enterica subsp. enterica]|nr:hypothetical protein KCP71_03910 [Salmonella enterica subsp. enterica]